MGRLLSSICIEFEMGGHETMTTSFYQKVSGFSVMRFCGEIKNNLTKWKQEFVDGRAEKMHLEFTLSLE